MARRHYDPDRALAPGDRFIAGFFETPRIWLGYVNLGGIASLAVLGGWVGPVEALGVPIILGLLYVLLFVVLEYG